MRKNGLRSVKGLMAATILAWAVVSPGFGSAPGLSAGRGFAFAAGVSGEAMRLELSGGAVVTLERVAPPAPEVFAGAPAYALWTRDGFAEPVRFRLSSNHAAYVRGWRLAIYRSGDVERRRPVQSFSGRGPSYGEALAWDGSVSAGVPRLRPGEELFYVFEATDRMGRVAASDPAPLLLARYVMPQQARTLKPLAQSTALGERPEMAEDQAYGLKIRVSGLKAGETLRLDGLVLSADAAGAAESVQILPPGRYEPKVELTRARGRTVGGALAFALGEPPASVEPRPLWGSGSAAAAALARIVVAPTRSAHYELANQAMIYLPDTDVIRDSVRAVIMVEGETAAALAAGEHYVLDSLQGRLALTSAGRDLMDGIAQGLEEGGQSGRLEIGYRPLAEEESSEDSAPSAPVAARSSDGAEFVVTYGDALGPATLIAAAEALIAETIAESAAGEVLAARAEADLFDDPFRRPAGKPVELAEAAPAPAPGLRAAPVRAPHPLDSPAPRAKPVTGAAPAPEAGVLLAAAEPPKAAQGELRIATRAAAASADRPAGKTEVLAAAEPSLLAQGLFMPASAPVGFEPFFWSEPAKPAAEDKARAAGAAPRPARTAPEADPAQLREMLSRGFILDRE